MFSLMDQQKQELQIASYSMGDSNLEDVFLKVSKLNIHHEEVYKVDSTAKKYEFKGG